MSLINEYRAKEIALKKLQEELHQLQESKSLQKEFEFENALKSLMQTHQKNADDVMMILNPHQSKATNSTSNNAQVKTRKTRKLKVYKNPHSGELIETRGGNHKILKAWKLKWGANEVEAWLK